MKVLFVNELKSATITALAPNANYPASNLVHVFAKVKYKGLGYSDTITAVLPDNVSASCFFYTYTNATSMTVRVYSNASVLLETLTVDCTYPSGAIYFPRHDNVRWIEIDVAAHVSEDIYIGGIALGLAFDFPYPNADFAKGLIGSSGRSISADGQIQDHYIEPRRSYSLSFFGVPRDETYNEIDALFKEVGSGQIWMDITESNHDVFQPLYCVTNMVESPSGENYKVSFKINVTEAR